MARNGAGVFTLAGTFPNTGDTAVVTDITTPLSDLESDANTARPVVAGGTGATTASGALTNLGAQPVDATLTSLAVLGTAADKMAYTTGVDTWAEADITSAGRALLDDADAAAQRTTLGLGTVATLDEVTTAQWRSNTADKVLSTDQVWAAMAEVTLTDGANIALDLSTGFDFTVTLGGNRTLDNPTNTKVGQRGRIRVVQDGTGSRTLSFGTSYEFAGGTAPTLTTTASAEDVLYYDVISSTRILVSIVKDIS